MNIGKWIATFILIFTIAWSTLFFFDWKAHAQAELRPLQPLIDQTEPGEKLLLQPGKYQGPVMIDKPIQLDGKGKAILYSGGDLSVFHIRANQVEITGLQIVDERDSAQDATIVLEGSYNRLKQLAIRTRGSGIQLREAHGNQLTDIHVEGLLSDAEKNTSFSKRGNGIDLWGSHDNMISSCSISNMQDGIYMESSESNRMENNYVSDSRYGYHVMFTKDIVIADNEGERNVTGAMVMGAEHTQVIRNRFFKQSENVNSQGLLLYDAKSTLVSDNHLEGNRVGIYVELSSGNQIRNNSVVQNFIGLQMIGSEKNDIKHNKFISNVVQAQAQLSRNNEVKENYWDDAQRIDLQGDQKSDLSYQVNPFFLSLTNPVPPFQLFFQSPGMMFLEGLFQGNSDQWMNDLSPLMQPNLDVLQNETKSQSMLLLLISSILLITSIFSISWGALKK